MHGVKPETIFKKNPSSILFWNMQKRVYQLHTHTDITFRRSLYLVTMYIIVMYVNGNRTCLVSGGRLDSVFYFFLIKSPVVIGHHRSKEDK